jgi:hypothetical protein
MFRDDAVTLYHAVAVHLLHRLVAATGSAARANAGASAATAAEVQAAGHAPLASLLKIGAACRGTRHRESLEVPAWEAQLARCRCRAARGNGRKVSLGGLLGGSGVSRGGALRTGMAGELVVYEDSVTFCGDGRFGLQCRCVAEDMMHYSWLCPCAHQWLAANGA